MNRKLVVVSLFSVAALLVFMMSSRVTAQNPNRLDRSSLILTFEENFAKPPVFYDPLVSPQGRWKTNYAFGPQDSRSPRAWQSRTHPASRELQYYGDPLRGTNPFAWQPGTLAIVGRPNPALASPATNGLPYLSGLMTTEKSFLQTYGYFEIRAALPVGTGLWPAFWLLPQFEVLPNPNIPQLPDEVDVFENIGKNYEVYATVHSNIDGRRDGTRRSDPARIPMQAVTEPHDYGVLITRSEIRWFIDSVEVRRRPNLTFHRPAYMLINLAVGGNWPGPPDATTRFPARMLIYSVRAYQFKNMP